MEAPHKGAAMCPPQKYYRLLHIQAISLLPLSLGSEAVWRKESPLQWNFMYLCSYPSQNRNTRSLKITSCVGGSSPPPSSQVKKRQVVPCYHPTQPHNAKAKSEQTRMGNERSECRTRPEIRAMLVLISAIKYIFLCLNTLNSKVPKTAIAAWTSL